MIFQSDLPLIMKYFSGEYSAALNSEDLHDPDLMLTSSRAKGGTLILWHKYLDPYVTVHIADSSSFLPIVLDLPGWKTMVHIATYLPTAGKEAEYLDSIASMKIALENLVERFDSPAVFLRGDCNTSSANITRSAVFSSFLADLSLVKLDLNHNTYHHFLGQGSSDSDLDVLLYSDQIGNVEKLLAIHCKNQDCHINSHHDLLVSTCSVPHAVVPPPDISKNTVAPRLTNDRHKIIWNEESINEYEQVLSLHLPRIRQQWLDSTSKISMTILLECTEMILSQTALLLNKSVSLSTIKSTKSASIPQHIQRSNRRLAETAKKLRVQSNSPEYTSEIVAKTKLKYKHMKAEHQKLVRLRIWEESKTRDSKIFSICSSHPDKLFLAVKSLRKTAGIAVKKLKVFDKLYEGDYVCDGFYDSINFLKTEAHSDLESSPSFQAASQEYETILKICQEQAKLPKITLSKTREILFSIRPAVSDYSSISGYHYRYSGESGLKHLQELLNAIIDDLNNLSIDPLNKTWACILHKGHSKDRTLADSYRTISSCPLVSKVLDTYVADLYSPIWQQHQAETQFQGKGSNHELAALLLTETIQYSMHSSKKPLFVLYLDAKSAFDLVLKEFLVNNLFHYGVQDQGLLLIDQRLKFRKTICEWDKQWMGPIKDNWGLEQGGKNSSEFYKVYNNEQLEVAQSSQLGVELGGSTQLVVSAIGQADDVALVSNDIFALQSLLQLSLQYCQHHHVKLQGDKTKLQVFSDFRSDMAAYYAKLVSPIRMEGKLINFTQEVQHVGLTRSPSGNLPHILGRFEAHRKVLAGLLPVGLAHGHNGNPSASLLIHNLYAIPVLYSGLAALVLKSTEISLLDQFLKKTVQRLMKLMDKTPACVVAFLGGQLPAAALLHQRQLVLFGMVSRLPGSVLHKHGTCILTSARPAASSWFQKVRDLCILYQLPHPLTTLANPPTKAFYNKQVKSKIFDYWEAELRTKALDLTSVPFFKPEFMSLRLPHPLWLAAGSNPFECRKAVIAARMLSGRYPTDMLQRHWSQNKLGYCLLPACTSSQSQGTLKHLLLHCVALQETRLKLHSLCNNLSLGNATIAAILKSTFESDNENDVLQLILDCTTLPEVIKVTQESSTEVRDKLLYLGRTWCYSIHRERLNQMGLLKYR